VSLVPICFKSKEFYFSLVYHNSFTGWNKTSAVSVTVIDDYFIILALFAIFSKLTEL
jgi:hypothetical protein